MTAVEFFDRTPVENIVSALSTRPDKIIYVGDGRVMNKWKNVYSTFLRRRGLDTELEFRSISGMSIEEIVGVLAEIVEQEDACIFEVTGGSESVLIAMGIVFERYRGRDIQMQYFRVRDNNVIDCDRDGALILEEVPMLDVIECVGLHGGVAEYERFGRDDGGLSEEFCRDIEAMWSVCRRDPGRWNFHAGTVSSLVNLSTAQGLAVSVGSGQLRSVLKGDTRRLSELEVLLGELEDVGVLKELKTEGVRISFRFKSAQIKKCMTKAGTVLELWVLMNALRTVEREGDAYYTDGLCGVKIDWDGQLGRGGSHDTENEIDVILTRGVTPVFISCKNGHIDDGELYKLNSVADRFGGEYAKKALVCTKTGRSEQNMGYLRQRARNMNITLIENVHKMEAAELRRLLRGL